MDLLMIAALALAFIAAGLSFAAARFLLGNPP